MTRITTLRIRDWGWARYLRAPALEQLAIGEANPPDGDYLSDIICPFVTVHHLALFAPCDVVELEAITQLINLTTLELCATTWAEIESSGELSETFFAAVVNFERPVWPKLKHMHLDTGFDKAPVPDKGLATFLRLRNETAVTELEGVSISRIETVKLGYKALEWLIREVERRTTTLHQTQM